MGQTLKLVAGVAMILSLVLVGAPASVADITDCVLSDQDSPPAPSVEEVQEQVECIEDEIPPMCVSVFAGAAIWRWTVEGAPVGPEIYPDAGQLNIVWDECEEAGLFTFAGAIATAECEWVGTSAAGEIIFKDTQLRYPSTECWGGFPMANLPVCVGSASISGTEGSITVSGHNTVGAPGVCS